MARIERAALRTKLREQRREYLRLLRTECLQLKRGNDEIVERLNVATQCILAVESENVVLRAQLMGLNEEAKRCDSILAIIFNMASNEPTAPRARVRRRRERKIEYLRLLTTKHLLLQRECDKLVERLNLATRGTPTVAAEKAVSRARVMESSEEAERCLGALASFEYVLKELDK
ncbi:hypothetical protein L1049_016837 [Liquidambar formosana]|uniref:Uncharacterized protein n=1 Tax=Liquidambar formosana TaxID=63359 RepID=A0AAP0X3Q6_LIQFO